MSSKKITHLHFHWGMLFFAIGLAFGSIMLFQSNQMTQFLISLIFAVFYFFWGVIHYFAVTKKHPHTVLEYLGLSFLIVVIAYLMFLSR